MKKILFVLMSFALSLAAAAGWRNVDASHYLAGRKASAGYLSGKVVLVVRWGAKNADSANLLPRLEEIWQSFKNKQFVLLAGHVDGWGGAEDARSAADKLSFSVYADAGLSPGEPKFDKLPFLYVVDETGKVVYLGRDDRTATQAVVSALTDMDAPKSVAQWKRFLDFELENLPAHAYNRLNDFRKKYPKEAKAYAEKSKTLAAIPDVKKVAELVAFSKRAKDAPVFGPKEAQKRNKYQALVRDTLSKCAPLKETADRRLVQEAKNALADLAWTEAAF